MLLDGIPTLWTCLSMQKIVPLQDPNQTQSPVVILNRCFMTGQKKKRPQQQVEVLVFLESNAIKRAIHGLSFRSIRVKRWIFPQIAVGIRNGWYLSMLFGVYAGIFFVASLKWDKFKFVVDLFFSVSEIVGEKKCCEFWLVTWELFPRKQPTGPLKFLGGSWPSQLWEKIPQKGNRKQQQPQATGILREVPFFREFDDVLSGPEEGFKPFRFNLEWVLLVAQLMVNWWFRSRWFEIRIAVPLWPMNPNPIRFRGSQESTNLSLVFGALQNWAFNMK